MNYYCFNQKGIDHFRNILLELKTGQIKDFPTDIIANPELIIDSGQAAYKLNDIDLSDKFYCARDLDLIINELKLKNAEDDIGFWSWCSAFLFKKLCKKTSSSGFKVGEIVNWIPEPFNWRRYYRHYLASIWRVFNSHKGNTELKVLLTGKVNTPGELWGQIAAYQDLITNHKIIELIYSLYWDKENSCRKRGAGGESPRRLVTVLQQFEKNFDLVSIDADRLLKLLPSEFDRFKN
jgi:hypothetical protein